MTAHSAAHAPKNASWARRSWTLRQLSAKAAPAARTREDGGREADALAICAA